MNVVFQYLKEEHFKMEGFQIRNLIDENNSKIQELLTPNKFILNKEVAALLKDNEKIRKQCIHEFQNGRCIYCDIEEEIELADN